MEREGYLGMKSVVAVLDKRDRNMTLSAHDKQQFGCVEDAAVLFEGRIYSPTLGVSGVEIIAKKFQRKDCLKASEAFLKEVEGDFSFIIAESERIIAGRDSVGVQPLYYGESRTLAALASSRKALWKLGVEKTQSFPPGHLAVVTSEGFKFKPVKTLIYAEPKRVTMEKAAETLQKLLEESVRRRVFGVKEVAVAFSGGLDSGVVAFLASKCRVNVHLIHVSLENRPETEEAKKAAEALRLPLQVCLFRESDVEKVVSRVVALVEESDPVKVSVGVPFYWAAEKAAESGFKVLLAGQGADELFGGYQRYVSAYLSCGREKVSRVMFDDVVRLYESNIERDVKICGFHGVELRLPFAAYPIAEFAVALPVELKIEGDAGSLRKLVLRRAAVDMGLPSSIVSKPKRAVQYATGVNVALKRLAKKQEITVGEYVRRLFLSQMTGK